MFQSEGGKNLLFKDSTKCLQDVQTDSYETFLGPEYMAAIHSLRQCSGTAPGLYNLESFYILIYVCTFSAFTVMLYVFFFLSDRSGEILHFQYLSVKPLVNNVENTRSQSVLSHS